MINLRRIRLVVLTFLSVLLSAQVTAETATIHLQDGSQLRGEVISLKGGAYTIATESAGTLSIAEREIELVEYGAGPGAETAQSVQNRALNLDQGMLQGMQTRLLADPKVMALIESLRSDADVQALVSDPEIKAAIASGDFLSLLNNPKFTQFMQNPKVRSITEAAK